MIVQICILAAHTTTGNPSVFLAKGFTIDRVGSLAIGLASFALVRDALFLSGAGFAVIAVRVLFARLNDHFTTGAAIRVCRAASVVRAAVTPGALRSLELATRRLAGYYADDQSTQC
jgi:hypothetical protein